MAKTLADATKKPANIGARVPDPPQTPVPAVTVREQPGLAIASAGPAPALWTTSYDSVKQFYRPGTSQQRFPPLPTKANPQLNAASASVTKNIIAGLTPPTTSALPATRIFLNKQIGTSYTVQLSDLNTLISMTNNAGGVVVLPRSTSGFQFVQGAQGQGTNNATIHMTNIEGDTLIVNVFTSPNVTLTTQTVSDTNGNTWTLLDTNTGNSEKQTMWVAYNVKGGPNTITANQAFTPPTPPPDQFPFFLVAFCDELGGVVAGGLDQIAIGVASASITPTVTPSVAYCSILAVANPGVVTPLTPAVGWTNAPFSPVPWDFPPYDGGTPGGVINGVDEYILNPTVGTSLVGSATGSFVSDCNAILANFKTTVNPGTIFPLGWYCYVENTSSANYVVQSLAPIDGVVQNITLPPNTGLLLVADGQGGWWTERGAGAGGTVVKSLEGLSGDVNITSSGASIAISVVGQNVNLEAAGGGTSPATYFTYPSSAQTSPTTLNWNNSAVGGNTNVVALWWFFLPYEITLTSLVIDITGSDTNHYDFGIYTLAGALKANIGATVYSSTGVKIKPIAQTSVTLPAGAYYFAWTGNGSAGLQIGGASGSNVGSFIVAANNTSSNPQWFATATASTGGALPSSITAPTTPTSTSNLVLYNNLSNTNYIPLFALVGF